MGWKRSKICISNFLEVRFIEAEDTIKKQAILKPSFNFMNMTGFFISTNKHPRRLFNPLVPGVH